MRLFKKRTREILFRATITFHKLLHVPIRGFLFVKWHPKGMERKYTPTVAVGGNEAVWEHSCTFEAPLAVRDDDNMVQPFPIRVSVRQELADGKGVKRMGLAFIDLAEYASERGAVTRAYLLRECGFNAALVVGVEMVQLRGDPMFRWSASRRRGRATAADRELIHRHPIPRPSPRPTNPHVLDRVDDALVSSGGVTSVTPMAMRAGAAGETEATPQPSTRPPAPVAAQRSAGSLASSRSAGSASSCTSAPQREPSPPAAAAAAAVSATATTASPGGSGARTLVRFSQPATAPRPRVRRATGPVAAQGGGARPKSLQLPRQGMPRHVRAASDGPQGVHAAPPARSAGRPSAGGVEEAEEEDDDEGTGSRGDSLDGDAFPIMRSTSGPEAFASAAVALCALDRRSPGPGGGGGSGGGTGGGGGSAVGRMRRARHRSDPHPLPYDEHDAAQAAMAAAAAAGGGSGDSVAGEGEDRGRRRSRAGSTASGGSHEAAGGGEGSVRLARTRLTPLSQTTSL